MTLNPSRRNPPAVQAEQTKAARNTEIVRRYIAGEKQSDLAAAFGLSRASIKVIVRRSGVPADPTRGGRQAAAWKRAAWANPDYRARQIAKLRATNSCWPDCPPDKVEDYRTLRKYMSATEARAVLEGRA